MANIKEPQNKVVTKKHLAKKERELRQTKIILIITVCILAVIVALVGYGIVDNYIVKPNKVVAQVGEEVIKAGDFAREGRYYRLNMINQAYMYVQYSSMFGDYGGSFLSQAQTIVTDLYDNEAVGNAVLDQMITRILMDEEAERLGISVSAAEIQEAKQAGFDFYPNGTPTPTITPTVVFTPTLSSAQLEILQYTATPEPSATPKGGVTETAEASEVATESPDTAETPTEGESTEPADVATPLPTATITPTPTPYTTQGFASEFKNYLDTLGSINFPAKAVDETFRYQVLQRKLLDEITKDLQPFEDQVWARHILVATEEEALAVIERLNSGEEFAAIASELSLDTGSSLKGGDLGWFGKGRMVAEFEEASFALGEGEISDPVQTINGWHVIQVIGKGKIALNANDFYDYRQRVFNDWLKSLRDKRGDIVIEENWLDYVPTTPEVPSTLLQSVYSQ